jgi:predicted XRE-type DNA-binding protein
MLTLNLTPKTASSARMRASLQSWYGLHDALTDHRMKNMTQQQAADRLQVTQPAVSVFENNNDDAKISTLISYAAAVGLEIEFSVRKADYPDLPEA